MSEKDVKKPRGARRPRRKACQFCVDKVESIDYKDVARLRRFVSERGKIMPRRMTGTCAKHQRETDSDIAAPFWRLLAHKSIIVFKRPRKCDFSGLFSVYSGTVH